MPGVATGRHRFRPAEPTGTTDLRRRPSMGRRHVAPRRPEPGRPRIPGRPTEAASR